MYIVQYGAWEGKNEDDRVYVAEVTTKKDVIKMYEDHIKRYKGRELDVQPVFSVWKGNRLSIKSKEVVTKFTLEKYDYHSEEHNSYNLPDIILDEEE